MKDILPVAITIGIITLSLVLSPVVLATTISFNPSSISILIDNNGTDVTVITDELPDGLDTYTLTAEISNPAIAEISRVSFPGWASANNVTGIPSSSCILMGKDSSDQVKSDATGIILGTLRIKGKGSGSATLLIKNIEMSDDLGGSVEPDVHAASITVRTSSEASGSSSGGGKGTSLGGSENTSTGTNTTNTTPKALQDVSVTQNISMTGSLAGNTSPAQSIPPASDTDGSYSFGSPSDTALSTPSAPSTPSPGSLPIPLPLIVLIVVMVVSAVTVLYLAITHRI